MEQGNAFTILGLHGMAPHVRLLTSPGAPLAFVLLSEPALAPGEFVLVFQLIDPVQRVLATGPLNVRVEKVPGVVNFMVAFQGVPLEAGKYTFRLLLGGLTHLETTFNVKAPPKVPTSGPQNPSGPDGPTIPEF
jgi:hypothetical protein